MTIVILMNYSVIKTWYITLCFHYYFVDQDMGIFILRCFWCFNPSNSAFSWDFQPLSFWPPLFPLGAPLVVTKRSYGFEHTLTLENLEGWILGFFRSASYRTKMNMTVCIYIFTRWWFQIFFIFTPIWGRFPIWLIFFTWVETTNQFIYMYICIVICIVNLNIIYIHTHPCTLNLSYLDWKLQER